MMMQIGFHGPSGPLSKITLYNRICNYCQLTGIIVFFLLAAAPASSANTKKGLYSEFGMSVMCGPSICYAGSVPYEGWEGNFTPPNSDMSINSQKDLLFLDVNYEISLLYDFYFITVGANLSMSADILSNEWAVFNKTVEILTVNWWNPVKLQTYSVRYAMPAAGIIIRKDGFGVQLSLQPYERVITKYRGIDYPGYNNTSLAFETVRIGSGISWIIDIKYDFNALFFVGFRYQHVDNAAGFAGVFVGVKLASFDWGL